jgi:hypothetical protein
MLSFVLPVPIDDCRLRLRPPRSARTRAHTTRFVVLAGRATAEQERIFKRSWQYVGVAATRRGAGQFFACRAETFRLSCCATVSGAARVHNAAATWHEIAEGCGRRGNAAMPVPRLDI